MMVYSVWDGRFSGIVGDGVADDTAALQAAINAAAANAGVLFLPPGTIKTTNTVVISSNLKIVGAQRGEPLDPLYSTRIAPNFGDKSAINITAKLAHFRDMALTNTALTTPTAGSGVVCGSNSTHQVINFDNVLFSSFYDSLTINAGQYWRVRDCYFHNCVRYNINIQNTFNPDAGDWMICDSTFLAGTRTTARAMVRYFSSGGGRICGNKMNGQNIGSLMSGILIDMAVPPGTGEIQIFNNNIENFNGPLIDIPHGCPFIGITDNFLNLNPSNNPAVNFNDCTNFMFGGGTIVNAPASGAVINVTGTSSGLVAPYRCNQKRAGLVSVGVGSTVTDMSITS